MSAVAQMVGENVRRLRKAAKLTLEGLSERAGVNFTTIAELERSETSPNVRTLAALAAGLGLEVIEFFRPVEEANAQQLERATRLAVLRKITREGRAWEIMDPLTGDWWTPKLSLSEVIKIHPQVLFRVKDGNAGGGL